AHCGRPQRAAAPYHAANRRGAAALARARGHGSGDGARGLRRLLKPRRRRELFKSITSPLPLRSLATRRPAAFPPPLPCSLASTPRLPLHAWLSSLLSPPPLVPALLIGAMPSLAAAERSGSRSGWSIFE